MSVNINLKRELKGPDGTAVMSNGKPVWLNELVATMFYTGRSSPDEVKFQVWSHELYKTGSIDVEAEDIVSIEKLLAADKTSNNGVIGNIKNAFKLKD